MNSSPIEVFFQDSTPPQRYTDSRSLPSAVPLCRDTRPASMVASRAIEGSAARMTSYFVRIRPEILEEHSLWDIRTLRKNSLNLTAVDQLLIWTHTE